MKRITGVLIGAGIRGGHVYAGYALEYPNEMKVVAVAELRNERVRKRLPRVMRKTDLSQS